MSVDSSSAESPLLVWRSPRAATFSLCAEMAGGGERAVWGLWYKGTQPLTQGMRAPSWFNYPGKASPPNTITLGFEFQHKSVLGGGGAQIFSLWYHMKNSRSGITATKNSNGSFVSHLVFFLNWGWRSNYYYYFLIGRGQWIHWSRLGFHMYCESGSHGSGWEHQMLAFAAECFHNFCVVNLIFC